MADCACLCAAIELVKKIGPWFKNLLECLVKSCNPDPENNIDTHPIIVNIENKPTFINNPTNTNTNNPTNTNTNNPTNTNTNTNTSTTDLNAGTGVKTPAGIRKDEERLPTYTELRQPQPPRTAGGSTVAESSSSIIHENTIVINARSLRIANYNDSASWRMASTNGGRYLEAARLVKGYWLEIKAIINPNLLSPGTTYAAYLIYNVREGEASSVYLDDFEKGVSIKHSGDKSLNDAKEMFDEKRNRANPEVVRVNVWKELELGTFDYDDIPENHVAVAYVLETHEYKQKRGLIVAGIGVRQNLNML